MSRLIFNADTLGGTTTLSSADAVGNFTITVPAVNGTLSVKDASNDATFRNITLTGAVLAGAWNGSTIAVAYGGTGATTLTGLVFGNGTSAMTAATAAQVVSVIGATFVTNATNATNATSATTATNIAGGLSGSIPYQTGAGATALLPSGTNGQVLTLTAGLPSWVSVAGTGTVTSVDGSGGTTGLTLTGGPITASGTLTLGGTLAVANGGTGAVTLTGYVKGSGTSAMTASATIPTTDLSGTITNAQLANSAITINGTSTSLGGSISVGTVTSVGGTGTVNGLTLTGTVTSSGSLTLGGTLSLVSPPPIGTTTPAEVKVTVGWAANTALTDAATIAWDTTNQVATFTFVSTNRTFGAPTNLKNGAFYALAVIQNAGSNTLTWNSVFKWASGTAPTLSTAAGAKDYFTFRSDGTNLYQQGISQAVA